MKLPGRFTALAFTDPAVNLPKSKRDYDGVEFFLDKPFADNWSLRTSYLWSRLYGNYSGLSQSDEQGRTSPNVGRLFDYPAMMFDQHGQPVLGRWPWIGRISSRRSSSTSSTSARLSVVGSIWLRRDR